MRVDDIPGHQLVKVDHDKDGNVINIYKEVAKSNDSLGR